MHLQRIFAISKTFLKITHALPAYRPGLCVADIFAVRIEEANCRSGINMPAGMAHDSGQGAGLPLVVAVVVVVVAT